MKTHWRLSIAILIAVGMTVGMEGVSGAAQFPEKPITLVVHASAGGGSDIFARTLAAAFEKEKILPQPIVVENKPGGSGAI
ncbi:MAG: tripartite tricarboxylate transporter substrate binding protein, partial [candidate division NC10 bacterium]|nr:tripartite tricarboxylate transporter substrate binding protein [candidate division NC10 bacterium]